MTTVEQVRSWSAGQSAVEEKPHHGFPSWRAHGRVVATLPDADHLNVMLDPEAIREAVAVDPDGCAEQWWGKTLAAVRVELARVDVDVVRMLLDEAVARAERKRR